ncbi:MAG: nucleotidyltransferase domain-containing protein [Bacteroidetes bacterium]|jgi:predicted nucleotidyltransferase|nr:nucleotidyltransferase domain-containing protein [Bacteroidota bacterium]
MKNRSLDKIIKKSLEQFPEVSVGILYGSAVTGKKTVDSDVDLAIAGEKSLPKDILINIVKVLAADLKRPIDLVDLKETNGTLLHQIISKGQLIYCTDRILYAELIKKMLYNQVDMMPYHNRILKERRIKWIHES